MKLRKLQRETQGWNSQDLDLLMSIFHPYMYGHGQELHNLMILKIGFLNQEDLIIKDGEITGELFLKNIIQDITIALKKIVISNEGDGAFAVVDVDTLWRNKKDGKDFHWYGRACKIYTKLKNGQWKMIAHTGL